MGTARRHALGEPAGRYHVWCSPHNPAALELLEELKQFGGWGDTREGRAAGWGDQLLVTQEVWEMASADTVLPHVERVPSCGRATEACYTAEGCTRHSSGRVVEPLIRAQ